jgi:hypothetical protein
MDFEFADIYGPLDKKACIYFSVLTIFFFVILVVAFIAQMFVLLKDFKHLTIFNIVGGIFMLFNIFIAYFVNRLLYNMCIRSLA